MMHRDQVCLWEPAANYANDAKWAHQRILEAPIWRHSRNSRLVPINNLAHMSCHA